VASLAELYRIADKLQLVTERPPTP
jgi:hypothetical protein